MKEYTYSFRLRALPKRQFRALVAANPPRQETDASGTELVLKQLDAMFNVNFDTFFDALVKMSIVDPVARRRRLDCCSKTSSPTTSSRLSRWLAWRLNKNDVDIPFSSTASRLSRSSEAE
jgi:hypothetical protein